MQFVFGAAVDSTSAGGRHESRTGKRSFYGRPQQASLRTGWTRGTSLAHNEALAVFDALRVLVSF